jgi:transposase
MRVVRRLDRDGLATAYYMKEDLRRFCEQPGKRFATAWLNDWLRRAEASGVRMLQQMAKTLAAHRTGLLAYYYAGAQDAHFEFSGIVAISGAV